MSADPSPARGTGPTIYLSAGETSGDRYGGRLARALRDRLPDVRLLGTGGREMASAGVSLLAELDDLAVLGLAEVVRSVPFFLHLRRRVRRCLVRQEVDLVVPIDYPGFNLPLARFASGRGIPVLYYIAPQVWAWHRSRIRSLARYADRLCVVLPFEEEIFREASAAVEFVGHPLLDESEGGAPPAGGDPGEGTGAGHGPDRTVLGLFPGSRRQEVVRLLPVFRETARRLRERRPGLRILVARSPHLDPTDYPATGQGGLEGRLVPPEEAARSATAALTKSGTMTLELALHRTPMVVAYRMHPMTFWLARHLVEVDHVALVNLIADRRLVPEYLQEEVEPEPLAEALRPLLDRGSQERRRMADGLSTVAGRLGRPGVAGRVADRCAELLGRTTHP